MKKVTKGAAILLLLNILIVTSTFADDIYPCSGNPDDPGYNPNGCPLDTYVWILAIAALVFGAVYLHRQQKTQSRV